MRHRLGCCWMRCHWEENFCWQATPASRTFANSAMPRSLAKNGSASITGYEQ